MESGTRFYYVGEDPTHPIQGSSKFGPWAGLRSLGIPRHLRDFKSRISYTGVHQFKLPSIPKRLRS